jgi:hypothetical protein
MLGYEVAACPDLAEQCFKIGARSSVVNSDQRVVSPCDFDLQHPNISSTEYITRTENNPVDATACC